MARRSNISVSLTPEQAAFLTACVESGSYQTSSEVVREALRLLQHRHALRAAQLERARTLIQEGADQVARGEVVDRDAFFDGWDEDLDDLEGHQKPAAG